MEITILSPDKKIFQGNSEEVTFFSEKGEFQILKGHANMFTLLNNGEIIISGQKKFSVSSGIIEVLNDKITVLIDAEGNFAL